MIKAEQIMNGDIPVTSYDSKIYNQMKKYWDSVAKPLDSMGIFETLISKVGAIHGLQAYDFDAPGFSFPFSATSPSGCFSFQVNYVKEDNTVIMIYNGD